MNTRRFALVAIPILTITLAVSSFCYEQIINSGWESISFGSEYRENYPALSGVRAMAIDQSNHIWIGTVTSGIFVWDGEQWKNYTTNNSGLISNSIRVIAIDDYGKAWIGHTDNGISIFDGEKWSYLNHESYTLDLSKGQTVREISFDPDGRLWIGRSNGIDIFYGDSLVSYDDTNSDLTHKSINAIGFDSSGNAWIGSQGGLDKFDGKFWLNQEKGLIYTIEVDSYDDIWVGSENGISVYKSNEVLSYPFSYSGLVGNGVSSIAFGSSGVVLAGTWGNGFSLFDGETWDNFTEDNSGLASNHIRALLVDQNGRFWVGTSSGLAISPAEEFTSIDPNLTILRNLLFHPGGSLWWSLSILGALWLSFVLNIWAKFAAFDQTKQVAVAAGIIDGVIAAGLTFSAGMSLGFETGPSLMIYGGGWVFALLIGIVTGVWTAMWIMGRKGKKKEK